MSSSSLKSECCVCDDKTTVENPILKCIECEIQVHQYCYGAEKQKDWLCSPCRMGQTAYATCRLCLSKGGAMKKTLCKGWVHVICALFTGGVDIPNVLTMEPIDLTHVSNTKRNKMCTFCFTSRGFCNSCDKSKCNERLHVTCAQKEKCLKEVESKTDGSIKFRAYCKKHKPEPPKTGRRVSSGTVQRVLEKKRKKQLTESSSKQNAEWILKAVPTIGNKNSKYDLLFSDFFCWIN